MRASVVFGIGESSERIVSVVGFVHCLSVSRFVSSSRYSPAVWVIGLLRPHSYEFARRSGWRDRVGLCGRGVVAGYCKCRSWVILAALVDLEVCVRVRRFLPRGSSGIIGCGVGVRDPYVSWWIGLLQEVVRVVRCEHLTRMMERRTARFVLLYRRRGTPDGWIVFVKGIQHL